MKKNKVNVLVALTLLSAALSGGVYAAEPFDANILSATVRDQSISGAEILLQKNGEQTQRGVSDASGHVHLPSPAFSADDPSAVLIVRKDGYSTLVARCPCNKLSYAISPVMQQLDGMRVVLSWGANPADLDGHLLYESSHVWYAFKNGPDAHLDVDHRDGYGPETITIDNRHTGQRYVYLVHDYSDKDSHGGNALERSQARVMVYVGQTLVRTYYPDPTRSGNLWTVFVINADGGFEDINQYSDLVNPFDLSEHSAGAAPAVAASSTSESDRSQAVALNREGEAAYQRRDYDSATRLFQQAVALYPDFGQAYSNLGLTFDKAGNEAEAIWADRKALSLASGADAPRVRASTYYNIARIYESKGEWRNALENYQAAEGQRPNDVYVSAIARMKSRLP